MINGKDTEIIKELVLSTLLQASYDMSNYTKSYDKYLETKPIIERAFDIVLNEMKIGKIYEESKKTIYGEFTGQWSLFIGRWQPLHEGHIKLMKVVLDEGGKVCIGIRDSEVDEKNPYTTEQRKDMIRLAFNQEIVENRVTYVILPDIKEVCHGRKVGWGVREIKLSKELESISGTAIRKQNENKKSKS